jgi:hypothetical protein
MDQDILYIYNGSYFEEDKSCEHGKIKKPILFRENPKREKI